jgi:MFS family permease
MMYLGELRTYWRFLTAAALGQAAGYNLSTYINNVFTPQLINQFAWSRSSVALVGTAALLGVVCQPIGGRLTDAFGVRRVALIGVVSAPLVFVGFGSMTGSFSQFFLLNVIQIIIVGGTTSVTIYSRLIAQRFDRARGIALAIVACAPAAAGAICVPFLSHFVNAGAWREGYFGLAVGTAIAGATAMLLIPAGADIRQGGERQHRDASQDYGAILRNSAFQLIVGGMVLCNLSFSMQTSQLKVILLDRGVDSSTGSLTISLFAISVVAGRLLCGLALDRLPTYAVAALAMGIPSVGLSILASGLSAPMVITPAVLLMGLSVGAESDVLAYLVMRFFRVEVYSTIVGLILGAIALSITVGSLLLSLTLKSSGSYTPFLVISGTSALVGGVMFLQLRRASPAAG